MEIEQEVSAPQLAILESTSAMNLFLAGTGSGKTYLAGMITKRLIAEFPNMRGGIFANTYDQLNTSTLFRIREYWQSTGMTEWSKENPLGVYVSGKEPPLHWTKCKRNFDRFNNIISFCNGGLIFTGSLDNAIMHSGKEMAWTVLDETKDSREEDIKEVIITRLRQPGIYLVNKELKNTGRTEQQFNPLYIFTSPAKVEWINTMFELEKYIDEISAKIYSDKTFFQKEFDNKFSVISSTYHNVHNVGENYIKNILANNSEERGKALVYGNPFVTSGGEFYSSFNRLEHVDKVPYDSSLPLHLSFDQNTVPYNSCSIWQVVHIGDLYELRAIDEIALQNPRNSTEEVCEEFTMRYPNHKASVFYYGDASGKNRSTLSKDFKHHYEIVEYSLRKYLNNNSNRVIKFNPSVVSRRDFCNKLLENKLPVRIRIDEGCHYLINDLMYCKQDIDGGKDKHIVTDKETGEKYQKYGHLSDCFTPETLVMTNKGEKQIWLLNVGDKVLTRKGFNKVLAVTWKGLKVVNTYQIGDRQITCTDEHKIYANNEFISVVSLIDKNINAIFARKTSWKEKLLLWMGLSFTGTRNQKEYQTSIITQDGLNLTEYGIKHHSIYMYGERLMVRLLKGLKCITSMAILAIIESRIYILSKCRVIEDYITQSHLKNIKTRTQEDLLNWPYQKQLNGINLKLAYAGTGNTSMISYIWKNIYKSVSDAEMNLNQTYERSQFGVRENASSNIRQEDTEQKGNIMKIESVKLAEGFSKHINGIKINSVHVPVSRIGQSKRRFVYDITVEENHEFFANGILVHNCFDYLVVELFKNWYYDKT